MGGGEERVGWVGCAYCPSGAVDYNTRKYKKKRGRETFITKHTSQIGGWVTKGMGGKRKEGKEGKS